MGCDFKKISQLFCKEEAECIINIKVGGLGRKDNLAWHYNKDGLFSVKSAYWVARLLKEEERNGSTLLGGPSDPTSSSWREKIWNLNVPNKVKKIFVESQQQYNSPWCGFS